MAEIITNNKYGELAEFRSYIIDGGGKIEEAPKGTCFNNYNGKNISSKKCTVIVTFAGMRWYGQSFLSIVKTLLGNGTINIFKMPYDACTRCGGSGRLSQYFGTYGGICFKCNGLGYTKRK